MKLIFEWLLGVIAAALGVAVLSQTSTSVLQVLGIAEIVAGISMFGLVIYEFVERWRDIKRWYE